MQSMLALCAAPAIVRADSLMRVIPIDTVLATVGPEEDLLVRLGRLREELQWITRRAFVPKLVVQLYRESPLTAQLLAHAVNNKTHQRHALETRQMA